MRWRNWGSTWTAAVILGFGIALCFISFSGERETSVTQASGSVFSRENAQVNASTSGRGKRRTSGQSDQIEATWNALRAASPVTRGQLRNDTVIELLRRLAELDPRNTRSCMVRRISPPNCSPVGRTGTRVQPSTGCPLCRRDHCGFNSFLWLCRISLRSTRKKRSHSPENCRVTTGNSTCWRPSVRGMKATKSRGRSANVPTPPFSANGRRTIRRRLPRGRTVWKIRFPARSGSPPVPGTSHW
jgi:hypothetical protein